MHKLKPEWILRIFLGLMFLYSGYDIVVHPTAWTWAVRALPEFVTGIIDQTVGTVTYLRLQGASELLLAFALLAWFFPRKVTIIAAAVATIEMFAITLLVGLDSVTFRDIGLIGAGWALFVILVQQHKVELNRTSAASARTQANLDESEEDDVVVEVMKH
jgi:hypothetical protein